MPTLRQLQARHPDAVMKWFARGRLWHTPEEAQLASTLRSRPAPADRRSPGWRPGGEHRDPRERFKVPRDEKRRRFARDRRAKSWAPKGDRPAEPRPPHEQRPPRESRPPRENQSRPPRENQPRPPRDAERPPRGSQEERRPYGNLQGRPPRGSNERRPPQGDRKDRPAEWNRPPKPFRPRGEREGSGGAARQPDRPKGAGAAPKRFGGRPPARPDRGKPPRGRGGGGHGR
jgi:hypothetical protein